MRMEDSSVRYKEYRSIKLHENYTNELPSDFVLVHPSERTRLRSSVNVLFTL